MKHVAPDSANLLRGELPVCSRSVKTAALSALLEIHVFPPPVCEPTFKSPPITKIS